MLLRVERILLELFLRAVGTGHLGHSVAMEHSSVLRYQRGSPRKYLSIFGEMTIVRAYYLKGGCRGVLPLEAQLNLPKRKYSYLLQKWMTLSRVRTTYEAAAQWMEEVFGINLGHRPIQRVTGGLTPVTNEFADGAATYCEVKVWAGLSESQFLRHTAFLKERNAKGVYVLFTKAADAWPASVVSERSEGRCHVMGVAELLHVSDITLTIYIIPSGVNV
jgi:hypothetical protein